MDKDCLSLKNPPEDSPSPACPGAGDDDSAPDIIVTANFSPRRDESDDDKARDKEKSSSASMCS